MDVEFLLYRRLLVRLKDEGVFSGMLFCEWSPPTPPIPIHTCPWKRPWMPKLYVNATAYLITKFAQRMEPCTKLYSRAKFRRNTSVGSVLIANEYLTVCHASHRKPVHYHFRMTHILWCYVSRIKDLWWGTEDIFKGVEIPKGFPTFWSDTQSRGQISLNIR